MSEREDFPDSIRLFQMYPSEDEAKSLLADLHLRPEEIEVATRLLPPLIQLYTAQIANYERQLATSREENARLKTQLEEDTEAAFALIVEEKKKADELAKRVEAFRTIVHGLEGTVDTLTTDSRTDALTGVLNRRAYDETLLEELKRAQRYERPVSVIMLDGDHFKRINDNYGHLAGDHILKGLANTVKANVRYGVDKVARYGGEEFAIILPETGSQGAEQLAEKIRGIMENVPLYNEVRITASFGVASYDPLTKMEITPATLTDMADKALYDAKRDGRNKVVVYNK
ncbi:GGDEF domain-containing protein [Candidatus Woesearchaeota archaeon]|nr:GGDEF domain-containing protein [Candidatus Woesearchaeota archaeon]